MLWSRACGGRRGQGNESWRRPFGELNHSEERRWQRTVVFYNRHGKAQQLRLFPDDGLPLLQEPDIVRVKLSSTGWTNAQFPSVTYGSGCGCGDSLKLGQEIVDRHLPMGHHTVRPADVVAIEAINRLCAPCSEFAVAEHWYASTGLEEDLLGIADSEITKDRLYRTLDALLKAKERMKRGRSQGATRDSVCTELRRAAVRLDEQLLRGLGGREQTRQTWVLTRPSRRLQADCGGTGRNAGRLSLGPLHVGAGNAQDVETVETIVTAIEKRFGKSHRVWVMDRGMISEDNLKFLSKSGRRYLIGTRRSELKDFHEGIVGGRLALSTRSVGGQTGPSRENRLPSGAEFEKPKERACDAPSATTRFASLSAKPPEKRVRERAAEAA